jgi:hypothetical protein
MSAPNRDTIYAMLSGLYPDQLAIVSDQVSTYYRTNLANQIYLLPPEGLLEVNMLTATLNERDFLQNRVETPEPEDPRLLLPPLHLVPDEPLPLPPLVADTPPPPLVSDDTPIATRADAAVAHAQIPPLPWPTFEDLEAHYTNMVVPEGVEFYINNIQISPGTNLMQALEDAENNPHLSEDEEDYEDEDDKELAYFSNEQLRYEDHTDYEVEDLPSPYGDCQGCLDEAPNQQAHMHPGGCLYDDRYENTW